MQMMDDPEDEFMAKMHEKLINNLRIYFIVDLESRGPRELGFGILKSIRLIPGVKFKELKYAMSFRYLEEVQEFVTDRIVTEADFRAFLVVRMTELDSTTLSDFNCLKKS